MDAGSTSGQRSFTTSWALALPLKLNQRCVLGVRDSDSDLDREPWLEVVGATESDSESVMGRGRLVEAEGMADSASDVGRGRLLEMVGVGDMLVNLKVGNTWIGCESV